MAREYFNAYHSYLENMKRLSDAEVGRLFRALLKYSATGELDDLPGNERFVVDGMIAQIDRDSRKYNQHYRVGRNPNKQIDKDGRQTPEYRRWRQCVLERDNYTCQMCGKQGGKLNVHHIERYRNNIERRTDVSNGITLCEKCHKELHQREG